MILFISCDVNDADDNNYSQSVNENGLTVFIKNGTTNSPGEIEIINYANQKIFIPFIHYPYCSFSIYSLQKKDDSGWERFIYDEFKNKWLRKTNQDSITVVCDEYRNPIELGASQRFKQSISNIHEAGEYQVKIYFRYSEVYNPTTPDKEVIINYFVK
jgi:hypothetical protein